MSLFAALCSISFGSYSGKKKSEAFFFTRYFLPLALITDTDRLFKANIKSWGNKAKAGLYTPVFAMAKRQEKGAAVQMKG